MLLQASYTIKPRTWPIWIVLALPGIPCLFLILQEPGSKRNLYLLGMVAFFGLVLFAMTKAYKIYFDDEELVFFAFGRKTAMKWSEVISSSIPWAMEGTHSAGISWQFHSMDGTVIEIPLGYYARSDMQALATQLIDKSKGAKISSRIHDFAAGKFPWYLF